MSPPTDESARQESPRLRRAAPDEAESLTAIALAAKRHWGYPDSWIQRWRSELTVTPDDLARHAAFVAVIAGELAGFCAVKVEGATALLDHLWVLPPCMGRGIGRALFQQAEATAQAAGARCLKIVGDPHAELFYLRMGATLVGRQPANLEGVKRSLPLLEKALPPSPRNLDPSQRAP